MKGAIGLMEHITFNLLQDEAWQTQYRSAFSIAVHNRADIADDDIPVAIP